MKHRENYNRCLFRVLFQNKIFFESNLIEKYETILLIIFLMTKIFLNKEIAYVK